MRSSFPSPTPDFELTPDLEAYLDHLAAAAHAGDPAARNRLYEILAFKLARFARRAGTLARGLEPDELTSETFLVLADLISTWPGRTFGRYLLAAFPGRLRRALRRLQGNGEATADETLPAPATPTDTMSRLVAEWSLRLPPLDHWLLCQRLLAGQSLATLARESGLPPRTLQRRWAAVVATLRSARPSHARPTRRTPARRPGRYSR